MAFKEYTSCVKPSDYIDLSGTAIGFRNIGILFSSGMFAAWFASVILGGPAAIADLGRGRCACLVSAPRQDPLLGANREGEAHILIFETSTGRILHEEPLGSRSWYPGHLAAGDGRLYATYSLPDRRGGAFLRAYDVRQEGEAPDRR